MALQYVGGTSGTGTASSYSVSLNGTLTGGIGTSPQAGDLVIVYYGGGGTINVAGSLTCSGNNNGSYFSVDSGQYANDTWDTNVRAFYEVQGATPDTQITVSGIFYSTSYGNAVAVQVWRGADPVTPLDGVTPVVGLITNASTLSFAAITPNTKGAVIIFGGANSQGASGSAITLPSADYSVVLNANGGTSDFCVAIGAYTGWTSGDYTPTTATGGATSNSSSAARIQFVIRAYVFEDSVDEASSADDSTDAFSERDGEVAESGTAGHSQSATVVASASVSESATAVDAIALVFWVAVAESATANHQQSATVSAAASVLESASADETSRVLFFVDAQEDLASWDNLGTWEAGTWLDGGATDSATPTVILASEASEDASADDTLVCQKVTAVIILEAGLASADQSSTIPQFMRPSADVTKGAWFASSGTDLYAMLDETVPSDSDFIETHLPSTCEMRLGAVGEPETRTNHVLRYRVLPGVGTIFVSIKQGNTTLVSWSHLLGGSVQDHEQRLPDVVAESITDYSDLRVAFETTQ